MSSYLKRIKQENEMKTKEKNIQFNDVFKTKKSKAKRKSKAKTKRKSKSKTEAQSIIFENDIYTAEQARQWLKKNGYKPIKRVDKTKNFLRYRLTEPEYKSYRTINVTKGIKIVLGIN